jgi:hypothetical protein
LPRAALLNPLRVIAPAFVRGQFESDTDAFDLVD